MPASREQVTDAIKAVHKIIEYLEMEYRKTNAALTQLGNDDALRLLHRLYDGRQKHRERIDRIATRGISSDDKHPDWLTDDKTFDERYR
jgi:hypothetical protein